MVFNMAAVGCCSMDRKDMGEKSATKLALSCKRNGLNHGCFCDEKIETRKSCRSQILDKIIKLNGVKTNNNSCFPRPSTPSLRSRRERNPSGQEATKRRRRSSRHDPGDLKSGEPPDRELVTPGTPDTPDSLEVASINSKCTDRNDSLCNSAPYAKDIKELLPLVSSTNGLVPITPDASRPCTPISLCAGPSPACSPISSTAGKGDTTPSKDVPATVECQWKDCDVSLDNGEIMEHIRSCHVQPQKKNETVLCLWNGCKVYNKTSCSKSWLDRHILTHSGDKPFRCIVAGCGARFTSQGGLERHVNSHFNAQEQSPNHKQKHCREDTPTKLLKRKKLKQIRGIMKVKTDDYFDDGIMEKLEKQLIAISDRTQLDLNGSTDTVTFHSSVIGKRTEESGKSQYLLHWTPADVIPDEWVPESQVSCLQIRSIPISCLPRDTVTNLHPSLYQSHRYRKHRRK